MFQTASIKQLVKFKLFVNYDSGVQSFNHYTKKTPPKVKLKNMSQSYGSKYFTNFTMPVIFRQTNQQILNLIITRQSKIKIKRTAKTG